MEYRDRAVKLIRRYGQAVTICTEDGSTESYALIQPLRNRGGGSYQGVLFTPAGTVNESRYLYIGEGKKPFNSDTVTMICAGNVSYHVEWSDIFRIEDETVYVRAILRICT